MAVNKYSYPQADRITNGFIDSGPYSAEEAGHFYEIGFSGRQAVRTPNSVLSVMDGVLSMIFNNLEPSISTLALTAESGAAMIAGRTYAYDTALTFNIPVPSVSTRSDRLCLVLNNTASPITQDTAGQQFLFPTSLTIYDNLSSIPAYTARLVVVLGTEGAGFPTVETDRTGIFMLPVAQWEISTGAVISNYFDVRRFVNSPLSRIQLIDEYIHTGANISSYLFSGIPQHFSNLIIEAVIYNTGTVATHNWGIQFNGDTTLANYGSIATYTSAPGGVLTMANTTPYLETPFSNGGAGWAEEYVFKAEIFKYARTDCSKFLRGHGVYWNNGTPAVTVDFRFGGRYDPKTPGITSLLVGDPATTNEMAAGSHLRLFGVL